MKTLVAASLLLALIVPAHASEFRESDRKWLPVMDEWAHTYDPCLKREWERRREEAEHKSLVQTPRRCREEADSSRLLRLRERRRWPPQQRPEALLYD